MTESTITPQSMLVALDTLPYTQKREIKRAFYKAMEGLRSLATALELADVDAPNAGLIEEHFVALAALDKMDESLLNKIF